MKQENHRLSRYEIPKDPIENLEWRRAILGHVEGDPAMCAALDQRCAEDLLLWFNLVVYIFEPRDPLMTQIPFVTWPVQDTVILEVQKAIRQQHDIALEKSRDMGATWVCVGVFLHEWLYVPSVAFDMMSRNEDLVYKKGNPDALFTKLEFALTHLPPWMQPPYRMVELHLENHRNGAVVDGEATTGHSGRGGRRTAYLLDELAAVDEEEPGQGKRVLAATADNTGCRIMNSTPGEIGTGSAFYQHIHNSNIEVLRMHWRDHPLKGAGLYTTRQDRIAVLDAAYEFPTGYPFRKDREGKLRSPAYDAEDDRRGSPQELAQEWDIEYLQAGGPWFDLDVLNDLEKYTSEPFHVGELKWTTNKDGRVDKVWFAEGEGDCRLRLWVHLGPDGRPDPNVNYIVSADVADGTGASNSAASVGDTTSRRKLADFVWPRITPEEFGRYFVAMCKFFAGPSGEAFGIWEANGPGRLLGIEVLKKQGCHRIYWRRREVEDSPSDSDFPGWWSTRQTKQDLLGMYRRALKQRDITIVNKESLEEAKGYIRRDGMPIAATVLDLKSGAREQHGDRVTADALLAFAMDIRSKAPDLKEPPPPNSYAGRRLQYQESVAGSDYRW